MRSATPKKQASDYGLAGRRKSHEGNFLQYRQSGRIQARKEAGAELTEQLTRLNNEIRDAEEASFGRVEELNFVSSASSFLLSYSIQSGEHIQYNEFAAAVDDQVLKDFLNLIIDHIVVSEGSSKCGPIAICLILKSKKSRFKYCAI